MNKEPLRTAIVAELAAELARLSAASKATLEAATSEESKPENQYDTRALEASYLAAAQEARVRELSNAVRALKEFPLPASAVAQPGALVEAESEGRAYWFFLLPFGAGVSVEAEGHKVSVVSPESPLGQALRGKTAGDTARLPRREYNIVALS